MALAVIRLTYFLLSTKKILQKFTKNNISLIFQVYYGRQVLRFSKARKFFSAKKQH